MSNKLPLSLLAVAVTLSGCSMLKHNPIYGEDGIIRDRSQDYETAQAAQRLALPPGMATVKTQENLVVPNLKTVETGTHSTEEFEVPQPEFFFVDKGTQNVNLRNVDGQKQIMVDEPIGTVWVKIKDFWKDNQIDVAGQDVRHGTMETAWIRQDAKEYNLVDKWIRRLTLQSIDGATKVKLRVSVRPDPNDYSRTSINMAVVQYPEEQKVDKIDWDEDGVNIAYKSDMMFEMLRYLSHESQTDQQSLMAMRAQRNVGPQLGRDIHGNPVLRLSSGSSVDEAWAALNTALDNSDIDVGTRDQQTGMIYLTYTTSTPIDENKKMGFFEWLNSDRGDIKISTDALDTIFGGGDDDIGGITYTSGKTRELLEKQQQQAAEESGRDELQSDLAKVDNRANSQGYKIWIGNKVVYVFGGPEQNALYDDATKSYLHSGRYQLKMERNRSGVFIRVMTDEGIAASNTIAQEILWAIKDQLPSSPDTAQADSTEG